MTHTELFEANRKLAYHFAHKYCRKYPWLSFDDLAQECLRGLWKSCETFDPKNPNVAPFGAFATLQLKHVCWNFVRDNHRRLSEVSLSEPRGRDESLTVADSVDAEHADAELSTDRGEARLAARIYDLRKQIETLSTLTDRQRDILRMFCDGVHQAEISRRLNRTRAVVCREMRTALDKLSRAMNGVARPNLEHCQIAGAWAKTDRQSAA